MIDYSKLSRKELRQYIANSPSDTDAYIKSSAELNRRLTTRIAVVDVILNIFKFWK